MPLEVSIASHKKSKQAEKTLHADSAIPSFESDYRKEFGVQPGWATANAFDSLNLLYDAAIRQGKRGAGIAEYLSSVKDYKGAAGLYSASGDNRFTLPATIKVVTETGFVKLVRGEVVAEKKS